MQSSTHVEYTMGLKSAWYKWQSEFCAGNCIVQMENYTNGATFSICSLGLKGWVWGLWFRRVGLWIV